METVELHYNKFRFDDNEFYDFCQQNDSLKFERDYKGNIYIMPNTGGKTGKKNSLINRRVGNWNEILQLGEVFDSSMAFKLPTSAVRSSDIAWVSNQNWYVLSESEQEKFPPICPDFVIELMSEIDNLKNSKEKMQQEWMDNGCRLGWLIYPQKEQVYIYRENGEIQLITGFDKMLSGEDVLPDFELNLYELL
jgi:Uma2 family endonuclease